jgi:hypothetical protein
MSADIEGMQQLLKSLDALPTKVGRSVLSSAIRGGLNVIQKQMKSEMDPKVKAAKRGIGTRFKKGKQVVAKVGVGVGKRKKPLKRARKRTTKGGVGIDDRNLHWWVAGTKQRTTKKTKGDRGKMPAKDPQLAVRAYKKAKGKILAEMVRLGKKRFEREVARLRKG